jgi:hypothetical protein
MSSNEATHVRSDAVRCKATKRTGERCRAFAGSGGLCALHADPGRAREIGRRGGQARVRGVDDAVAASELGRARLVELAQSDDARVAIAASRALFSYGSTRPPADEAAPEVMGSEDALLALLETPETWTPRLREAINNAAVTDPEVKRKIDAFTREVMLGHGRTIAGLEEVGLIRVHPDSETEKLRDAALEAKRKREEARSDLA